MTCAPISVSGLRRTGFMWTDGGSRAARACSAWARPISPPSAATAALFDMFCGLNGATLMPAARRVPGRAPPRPPTCRHASRCPGSSGRRLIQSRKPADQRTPSWSRSTATRPTFGTSLRSLKPCRATDRAGACASARIDGGRPEREYGPSRCSGAGLRCRLQAAYAADELASPDLATQYGPSWQLKCLERSIPAFRHRRS